MFLNSFDFFFCQKTLKNTFKFCFYFFKVYFFFFWFLLNAKKNVYSILFIFLKYILSNYFDVFSNYALYVLFFYSKTGVSKILKKWLNILHYVSFNFLCDFFTFKKANYCLVDLKNSRDFSNILEPRRPVYKWHAKNKIVHSRSKHCNYKSL